LITTEVLKELKSRGIRIALNPSYDSLQDVENKILKIKEVCKGCALFVCLNDANLSRATEIAKLAVKHNCFIRINRMYQGSNNSEYIEEYGRKASEMLDVLLAFPKPAWPNWVIDSVFPLRLNGNKNSYSCGKGLFVVDWDGMLRSCNPDYDSTIGSIRTHLHLKDFIFPQKWNAEDLSECKECSWLNLCQGGCPYTRKIAYGIYGRKTPFCEVHKKIWPKLLELTEKWKNSHRELYEKFTYNNVCQ